MESKHSTRLVALAVACLLSSCGIVADDSDITQPITCINWVLTSFDEGNHKG